MPDFAKKAAKRVAAVADDGESTRAALFVRPCTGETAKALGAPGGVLSHVGRLADDVATSDDADALATSDAFARNAVLVLTDHRLLVFGHGSFTGRVKDLVAAFDLQSIDEMRLETPDAGTATLEIAFGDGAEVRLVPGSRRKRFVDAFDEGRLADA